MMFPSMSLVNSNTLKPATFKDMVLAKAVPFQRLNQSLVLKQLRRHRGMMSHATYGMKNSALVMHPHANIGMFVRAVVVSIVRMYARMQGSAISELPYRSHPQKYMFLGIFATYLHSHLCCCFLSLFIHSSINPQNVRPPRFMLGAIKKWFRSHPHPDSLIGSCGHLSDSTTSTQSFLGCLLTTQLLLLTHLLSIPTWLSTKYMACLLIPHLKL